MSEPGNKSDNDPEPQLGKRIKQKITDDEHIKGCIVAKSQILFERYEMGDAHDDQSNKYQSDWAVCAEQHREKDKNICKAKIDRWHGDSIQRTKKRKLAVNKSGCHHENARKDQHACPKYRWDREKSS